MLMRSLRPLLGERRRQQIDRALASYEATRVVRTGGGLCETKNCDRVARVRGMCRRHYEYWRRHGGDTSNRTLEVAVPTWPSTSEADRHWLAGLLEGEGSFAPGPPRAPSWAHMYLQMCDRDVVERAAGVMGARSVWSNSRGAERGWRPIHGFTVGGEAAVTLMRSLRPLMGERRQAQIDRALASRELLRYVRLIAAPEHCVIEGCEATPRGRGLCHRHYMRWLRTSGSSTIRESRRIGASMK